MEDDPLSAVRLQIGLRLAEIREAGQRLSPLDLHAKMDAIRELAAAHGFGTLEGLARHSAQLALLPGHMSNARCCLEHVDEALESRSESDCDIILAALAARLQ